MPVLAVLSTIWALPEPAILLLFHSVQEELADDVGFVGLLSSMLLLHNLFQLLLIPLLHAFILILPPTHAAERCKATTGWSKFGEDICDVFQQACRLGQVIVCQQCDAVRNDHEAAAGCQVWFCSCCERALHTSKGALEPDNIGKPEQQ